MPLAMIWFIHELNHFAILYWQSLPKLPICAKQRKFYNYFECILRGAIKDLITIGLACNLKHSPIETIHGVELAALIKVVHKN